MKVILRSDVARVGKKGEVKDVSNGYASNFLIPRGLAEVATAGKVKDAEIVAKEQEARQKVQDDLLEKNLESLQNVSVEVLEKANEKGHLYEGVGKNMILKALHEQAHTELREEHLKLDHPVKEIGEHKIDVIAGDKKSFFVLSVKASE